MTRLRAKMNPLPALIAGLMMAAPLAQANVEGVTLTFSPGKGLKPQVQVERGAVAAGQRYATGASEIQEVLFPDGTSITLAPNAEMTIDAFDYPETGGGRLVLRVEKGLVRIAGGRLSENTPIVVRTAAGEIRLDAASAVVEVDGDGRTRTSLLVGRDVEMVSGGQTQSVQHPGFELISMTSKTPPEGPARQAEGAAARDAFGLGTAQLAGLTQAGEDELGRAGVSELAAAGATTLALATEQRPPGTVSSSPGAGNPGPGETPPPSPGFAEIGSLSGGGGTSGFGIGLGVSGPQLAEEQPSEDAGSQRSLLQNRGNATVIDGKFSEPTRREYSPTTNRLFNSADPYSGLIGHNTPSAVEDTSAGDPKLEYVFWQAGQGVANNSAFFPGIELLSINDPDARRILTDQDKQEHILQNFLGANFDTNAPFMFLGPIKQWPKEAREVVPGDVIQLDIPEHSTFSGSIFGTNVTTASHWEILQAGFKIVSRTSAPINSSPETAVLSTMERDPDNFLLVEVRPGRLDTQNNPELDPTRTERFLFATGNVDGRRLYTGDELNPGAPNPNFTNTFAVDRFFISAGLEKFEERKDPGRTVASGIRAFLRTRTAEFLRTSTAVGLNLTDSGLFVVNNGPNLPTTAPNGFLHADFGMQGTGSSQQSTISVTLGSVQYVLQGPCPACGIQYSYDAVAQGNTIASSRGGVTSGQFGTVAISSPLMSTSFGGGNLQVNRAGYAGYFVLENYTPAVNNVESPAMPGGTEHGLGSASSTDVNYAVLRLATATGQVPVGTRGSAVLTGWAGGLAEKENGPGAALTINPIGSGTTPNNLVIQTDSANNRVQADLLLSGHALMTLGGPNNPSTMIDDNRFAAANASVAMVNANVLRDSGDNLPASLNLPNGQPIPKYQYLQWGFLLGDTSGKAGVDLEHLHMGTWIAGRAADQLPTTGSATYSGHAIGNVANGGALYTAVGSYDNTWNFAQRAGTVKMNFDGAQYNGTTQLTNGTNFQGTMAAAAASRAGGVIGNFVQAPGGSPAGTPPPAVAGRFVIQETAGSAYRASGTFGAEQRH
ncbi:FecR family protein [Paraburkholderia fungorum]|uniref:FecR domain-containing protein n=1 Tax=Paraburkholderia fungorum TaxID=134537 RepID=UPI0038B78D66